MKKISMRKQKTEYRRLIMKTDDRKINISVFRLHFCSLFSDFGLRTMKSKGQAVIVLVMIVAIVSLLFTHVALLNLAALGLSNEQYEGTILRTKAEGYLENAAMRYLRDISYTGESLNEGTISCTIVVADLGGFNRDFESTCEKGQRAKTVGMQVSINNGVFDFTKIAER